jgi:hypothetical protein
MKAILYTNRVRCFYITREYSKNFRKMYNELEIKAGKVEIIRENYDDWLLKHNCLDNCENKTCYLIDLRLKEKSKFLPSDSS